VNIFALDESGKPVNWWFVSKVPKLSKTPSAPSATGYEDAFW